jgi:hypothetical protein
LGERCKRHCDDGGEDERRRTKTVENFHWVGLLSCGVSITLEGMAAEVNSGQLAFGRRG